MDFILNVTRVLYWDYDVATIVENCYTDTHGQVHQLPRLSIVIIPVYS